MFTSIIDRYKSFRAAKSTPSVDASLNHTYLTLYRAQRNHSFLEVTIEDDDVVYQSMILALDPEERTILIDELFPLGFVGLPGQKVKLRIRLSGGRKINFDSEIVQQHQHDGTPLYVLAMPNNIDTDQRRNAFRLSIGDRFSIDSRFEGPDQKPYYGRLRNLSSTGVALDVFLETESANSFNYDDALRHVKFDFAGINFDCGLALRNVEEVDEEPGHFLIGGEFTDMDPHDQRTLERSIMRIQRDRQKIAADQSARLATG